MDENLKVLLEHLINVLDTDRQDRIERLHQQTLNWEPVDRLPVIVSLTEPEELRFKPFSHGETFGSPEKMLYNELVYAFNTSIASRDVLSDDLPCTIRPNFGTVVIASMFGAHVEQVGDNPPWIRHEVDDGISFQSILDQDPLDFSKGWCPQVEQRYQFYESVLADYPELKPLIHIVLPDLQGPFDNLELIVGSDVFTELYVNPEFVSKALEAMATTQIGLAKHFKQYINDGPDTFSHQHATMIKGNILLRNDSVIMMSPEMYRDLVASHDERVMSELGCGAIHSCGKADNHTAAFLELPSIRCLDLGQPEMNDVDKLYLQLKQRQIPIVRMNASREDLVTAQIMERFPTGVTLRYEADSILDAKEVMGSYIQSTSLL